MRVRDFQPEDETALKAAYLARGFPGGWRDLRGLVGAVVVEDEDGRPVAFAGAQLVPEARMVVDPNFGNPKLREDAMLLAHDAALEKVQKMGFPKAVAQLEGSIGRGFGKRLKRLRGWLPSRGAAWERGL